MGTVFFIYILMGKAGRMPGLKEHLTHVQFQTYLLYIRLRAWCPDRATACSTHCRLRNSLPDTAVCAGGAITQLADRRCNRRQAGLDRAGPAERRLTLLTPSSHRRCLTHQNDRRTSILEEPAAVCSQRHDVLTLLLPRFENFP